MGGPSYCTGMDCRWVKIQLKRRILRLEEELLAARAELKGRSERVGADRPLYNPPRRRPRGKAFTS